MPFHYNIDNVTMPIYSEISRTLDTGDQNFAQKNATHLSFWYRGHGDNTVKPGDDFYVALNGIKVIITQESALTGVIWQKAMVELAAFAGLDLNAVEDIALGIGSAGAPQGSGIGLLYIDDIKVEIVK